MMEKLIGMYEKGAITADQLVVESLHMLNPKSPELVLAELPPEVLERMVKYVNEYKPKLMRFKLRSPAGCRPSPGGKALIEAAVKK